MDQNNKILEKNTKKCKYCQKITSKSKKKTKKVEKCHKIVKNYQKKDKKTTKKGGLRKKWIKNTQKNGIMTYNRLKNVLKTRKKHKN